MSGFTVREFLAEFCDEACESVDIINTGEHIVHHYDGNKVDTIPESLLNAKVKDQTLCYNACRMSHEICLYI